MKNWENLSLVLEMSMVVSYLWRGQTERAVTEGDMWRVRGCRFVPLLIGAWLQGMLTLWQFTKLNTDAL